MIKNYSFKNLCSYRDECFVDFTVNKKAPHSYYDYELIDGTKVAKVMAVLGANGAGKSNLLKPLSFLSWFIPDSFGSIEKDASLPLLPYLLNHEEENTRIDLEFVIPVCEDIDTQFEYKYSIEFNENQVIYESLKFKTSKLYSNVLTRTYNHLTKKYDIKNNKKIGVNLSDSILERAPSNCSIISYAMSLIPEDEHGKNDYLSVVSYYFGHNKSNIGAMGRANLSDDIDSATEFYLEHPNFFDRVKRLLMGYDLGISDISLEKKMLINGQTGKEIEKVIPMFLHSAEDGEFEIPVFLESSGTQSAYCILALITETLKCGGVAILDEFDNDLHPLLTIQILELFKDPSVNKYNAQLLFNTHTVDVLKELRMQHCYLVEKNDGISEAYRADDVEGLLARDNLYAKYISGALGAIPEFN
ncbi:AAA family ATPase [Photobacterium damselae]